MKIDKLPYELTEGVTATREGLAIGDIYLAKYCAVKDDETNPLQFTSHPYTSGWIMHLWRWSDAAERLRYREGEPWCQLSEFEHLDIGNTHVNIVCFPGNFYTDKPSLHRLAAILCEDADAFRVLLWCVHNLGEN